MTPLDLFHSGGLRSGLFSSLLQEGFLVPVHVFQKDGNLLMDQTESPVLSQKCGFTYFRLDLKLGCWDGYPRILQ